MSGHVYPRRFDHKSGWFDPGTAYIEIASAGRKPESVLESGARLEWSVTESAVASFVRDGLWIERKQERVYPRRFRCVKGWYDEEVDYVTAPAPGAKLLAVRKDGTTRAERVGRTEADADKYVADGDWVEVFDEPSAQEHDPEAKSSPEASIFIESLVRAFSVGRQVA